MRIDLHAHSTASDGTDSPAAVVRLARGRGLDVLALTDHDTVEGVAHAVQALPEGLTLVPGMELSCAREGRSVHLLAYLFDAANAQLAEECARIRDDRVRRARAMVAKLQALGVDITWDQVADGDGVVGRPHIARAMIAAGVVASIGEAFTPRWIGPGGRAYVARYALDPAVAVQLVREAGGVSVVAHPGARQGVPASWIAELAAAGLNGLEADHPDHSPPMRAQLVSLAGELGLVVTGSSDYHGDRGYLGSHTTSPEAYSALTEAASGSVMTRPPRS